MQAMTTVSCWRCGAPPSSGDCVAPGAVGSVEMLSRDTHHLLRRNELPTDSEIRLIEDVLAASTTRIRTIKDRISSLSSTIADLSEECNHMETLISQHTTVLSPVRRVPPEILGYIFAFTPCTRSYGTYTVNCPPWRLAHVSRYWRNAALGDPRLWNSIEVSHSGVFPAPKFFPTAMLETQYRLSGDVPLDITVTAWDRSELKDSAWSAQFLSTSPRWRSLRIPFNLPVEGSVWDLIRLIKGHIPLLEAVELQSQQLPADLFLVAPKLREANLTSRSYWQSASTNQIPWGQILHYRGNYNASTQLRILQQATALVSCGLSVNPPDFEGFGRHVITLPQLQRMELWQSELLNHLTAPELKGLILRGPADLTPSFIHRSGCALTRLVVVDISDYGILPEVLKCTPTLESLILDCPRRTPPGAAGFFTLMKDGTPTDQKTNDSDSESNSESEAEARRVLCPNLRVFGFGDTRIGQMAQDSDLLAMLRARFVGVGHGNGDGGGGKRLTSLRVWLASDAPEGMWRYHNVRGLSTGIKMLADDGFDAAFVEGPQAGLWMERNWV
ncbi:hypothetical protein FB45DRAFT_901793 [Roridomyces roridus]|uniref:F-box domain-containing protein n=1 Tax=Roridomyces roridus TaxID=1738132 RepID=A0AAD7C8Y4_9AGAR|nr:hypothetical protein FB45DRAFT_901793 [Roridomyces roridus]